MIDLEITVMTTYPEHLTATDEEVFKLPSGSEISIPKALITFQEWRGAEAIDNYGGKAIIDLDGEPLFAELAILRLFEKSGWSGVWVDTYRRKFRTSPSNYVELPDKMQEHLSAIYERANSRNGCWDVFCWKGDDVVFVESKRSARDRIRSSQLIWLESALAIGIPVNSFLVIQWTM